MKNFVSGELKDAAIFTEAKGVEVLLQKLEKDAQKFVVKEAGKGCDKLLGGPGK